MTVRESATDFSSIETSTEGWQLLAAWTTAYAELQHRIPPTGWCELPDRFTRRTQMLEAVLPTDSHGHFRLYHIAVPLSIRPPFFWTTRTSFRFADYHQGLELAGYTRLDLA